MIESLDEGIGRLIAALDEPQAPRPDDRRLHDRQRRPEAATSHVQRPAPRRERLRLRRGRARAADLLRIPPRCPVHQRRPAMSIDLFPTLLELCGLTARHRNRPGTASASCRLLEKGRRERDALYWHYPHYHPGGATPYGRSARRLAARRVLRGRPSSFYNCKDDIGETTDLGPIQPEKHDELHALLKTGAPPSATLNAHTQPQPRPPAILTRSKAKQKRPSRVGCAHHLLVLRTSSLPYLVLRDLRSHLHRPRPLRIRLPIRLLQRNLIILRRRLHPPVRINAAQHERVLARRHRPQVDRKKPPAIFLDAASHRASPPAIRRRPAAPRPF